MGEFIGETIAEKILKPKSLPAEQRIKEMLKKQLFHQRKDKEY